MLLVAIVTGAQASTVSDLATLSASRNVYFEDFMNANLVDGNLYDSNYLLSIGGNTYKTDQGTDPTINKKYTCRVKSTTRDVLAFKVSGACTLVLYASRITDRTPYLNTTIANDDNKITGTDVTAGASGKKYGKATYTIPAAGTYYIIGSGSDCYLAGLEFTFAGAAKDYTVTAATNNSSYGTASAALSSLDEGETTEITAIAKAGYEFTSWSVEGEGASLSSTTDNPTTLTMGTANATVTATFSVSTLNITHNDAENGTYTISVDGGAATSGNTTATIGQTITLVGTPVAASFTEVSWNVKDADNKEVTVTDGQFTMPGKSVTISPVFSKPYFVKVAVTGAETADVTPTGIANYDIKCQSNTKLGSKGHYVGFTLVSETLKAGDIVEVKISQAGGGKFIFYDSKEQTNTILSTDVPPTAGTHRFVLPATAEGENSLYIVRGQSENDGFNPYVTYIAIIRPEATVTLNAKGFATYSKATDFEFLGATAYKMALNENEKTITGTAVTGKIKAGEGILLKGAAGAKVSIIETTGAEDLAGNDLKGTTTASGKATVPTYCYTLSGDTFKKFKGDAFNDNKAYLESENDLSGQSLEIIFDDQPTAINFVVEDDANVAVAPVKTIKNGQLFIGNYNVAGARIK